MMRLTENELFNSLENGPEVALKIRASNYGGMRAVENPVWSNHAELLYAFQLPLRVSR